MSAREIVDLLEREAASLPRFGRQTARTYPVDYKVWSVMQEKVYKGRIKDVDELRSRVLPAWDKLDQRVKP